MYSASVSLDFMALYKFYSYLILYTETHIRTVVHRTEVNSRQISIISIGLVTVGKSAYKLTIYFSYEWAYFFIRM